jgi:hypothetical protein
MAKGTPGACRLRYIGKVDDVPRIEAIIELAMRSFKRHRDH